MVRRDPTLEFVQPIRDKKQIEGMKKILKSSSMRDYVLFIIGINSALRISDLLRLKQTDVQNDKGKIKDRIEIREKRPESLKTFRSVTRHLKRSVNIYLVHPQGHLFLPAVKVLGLLQDNKPIVF
jgi:integrase